MPGSLVAFVAAVIFGAVAFVVHLAVLFTVLRAPELSRAWRYGALLPLVTPVAAWRSGRRGAAVVWGVALLAYLLVRVVGAVL